MPRRIASGGLRLAAERHAVPAVDAAGGHRTGNDDTPDHPRCVAR